MESFIYAPATPNLVSALSIIRLSGEGCFEAVDGIFSKKVSKPEARDTKIGEILDGTETIDQVVMILYPSPNSYTGEDSIEIICHGSPLIVSRICELLRSRGGRLAEGGEFTARAFYNGKLDLVQAEAVDGLIKAKTEGARKMALSSLKGVSSNLLKPIRDKLGELLAGLEVNIDYPEYEDIAETNLEETKKGVAEVATAIDGLIKDGREGTLITSGIKVALVGEPNVGKSSILNAILRENKAIVSSVAGTTRDVVEGETTYKGFLLRFLDTAGLRAKGGSIEMLGIKKSYESAEGADIVVYVHDNKDNDKEPEDISRLREEKPFIDVYNKADLMAKKEEGRLYISALNDDVAPLLEAIVDRLGLLKEGVGTPSLYGERNLGLLRNARSDLGDCLKAIEQGQPSDIVSSILLSAYNNVREILGEGATRDLSDEIFSRFCVGK